VLDVITLFMALQLSAAQSAYIGTHTLPLRDGTSEIHGRVLDAASHSPIAGLDVHIIEVDAGGRGPAAVPRNAGTRTDAAGRFAVTGIGAGAYHIRVTGITHLPSCIGTSRERSERCERVHVDHDQVQREVVIYARPAASIRGRIFDHDRRPKASVSLSAMCSGPELCLEHAKSDAAGRFEIGSIPPGDVVLLAEFDDIHGGGSRVYYPGVWKIEDALPVALYAGRPVDIDFRLPKAVMGSISARVVGPEGFQLDRFELSESSGSMRALDRAAVTIDNLREGRYVLHARASAGGKQYAGFKRVDVADGDVEVFIQLEEAGVINGRIIAEDGSIPPLERGGVSAWWWIDDDVVGAVHADFAPNGVFTFDNVFGDRTFKFGLAPGWRVVSIRADGKEVTDVLHIAPGSRTQLTITVGRQ
jgi:hypothetical protein